MAEMVISSMVSVLVDKLVSAALEKLAPYNEIGDDIKKLQRSLIQIKSVLVDASQKEIADNSVKRWLNRLQHLAYDIDDILDELATEAMDREFTDGPETHISKVTKFFSNLVFSKHAIWSRTMKDKITAITTNLKDLFEEKDTLGLIVKEEPNSKNKSRKLQTSMVHASSIIGRQAEKEAYVEKLLRGESGHQNFSIVPIVGMGGVGKTTLARLLYDEKKVKDHFKLKAWVCVSDEFDSFAISKVIFQSVTGENKDFADLNLLQVALSDQLMEKKFLLVLDDVWSENYDDWETLVGPFHACAPGSKIIVTTRKDQLLRHLGYNHPNRLDKLSHEDALSLIALQALGVTNFDSHLSLKSHAVGIVKKCDGLPLALKALGRLLSTRNDEEYWKKVLDSEVWNLPVKREIIPALQLSYHDLSARLKKLFAYCSLFPKDHVFDKEQLVLLWMAEGFLHQSPSEDSTEENKGREYFDELFSRSFFQYAPNNESRFVMHDMMSDLATYVADELSLRLDTEAKKNIQNEMLEQCRHMSFIHERYSTYRKFEAFKVAKSLRTFMLTSIEVIGVYHMSNKVMLDLLPGLSLLRVLSLSDLNISEVPESIGMLRHLRYLNLSKTHITRLPENVGKLYNLQTLILAGCRKLAKLPNNFLMLKNLRHLDIRDTPSLDHMPLGISELKNLQTLSKIIIGGESEFEIVKLKNLENLCGQISIVGLEKVKNANNAREANFSKNMFSELELQWSDVLDSSRSEMLEKDVLNELKPCNDKLMQLKIWSYGGLELPNWVGDPSFLRLTCVRIGGCKRCTSLPPLGQLPLLKDLFIEGLDEVKVVGLELFGMSCAFPALEILSFKDMQGWKKWLTKSGDVFPRLQKLILSNCPNLVEVVTLEALPLLKVLEIRKCDSGVLRRLVEVSSKVKKLKIREISGLDDMLWGGVTEHLRALETLKIHKCHKIRYLWDSNAALSKVLNKLEYLSVKYCDNLVSLGEDDRRSNLLTYLRRLKVYGCINMERCSCPDNIEVLDINSCEVTTILLPRGQTLRSLTVYYCNNLLEMKCGGKMLDLNRSSMHVPELNYLVNLTYLTIHRCASLESFRDDDDVLPSLTSLNTLRIEYYASFGFWPPNLHTLSIGPCVLRLDAHHAHNFPTTLVNLYLVGDEYGEIGDEAKVRSISEISHLLPSSLTHLTIQGFKNLESAGDGMGLQHLTSLQSLKFWYCPNLKKLSNLQHLTSLKHLEFWDCPILSTLSHPQHPTSLQHLYFYNCPKMMDLPEALLPSLLSLTIAVIVQKI